MIISFVFIDAHSPAVGHQTKEIVVPGEKFRLVENSLKVPDVEGCLSQNVLFQPNMRVFLQYSVKSEKNTQGRYTEQLGKGTLVDSDNE